MDNNDDDLIEVTKLRLSKLRTRYSHKEIRAMSGQQFWTSNKEHHIELCGVQKGKILIKDLESGEIYNSTTLEKKWKNPNFWSVEVLEFKNGLPAKIKDQGGVVIDVESRLRGEYEY